MVNFERKETYSLQDLIEILRILRAPGGCPWDRAQTHLSDRRNFLEEAYEAAEAFDRDDPALMCEELGDMLMQVIFNIHIEEDAGRFTTDDVTDHICKKLIFRHPHVFGTAAADTSEEVLVNWEALKRQEKGQQTTADAMDAVARSLPALWRADKLQSKAAKAGFEFADVSGALERRLRRLHVRIVRDRALSIETEGGAVCAVLGEQARYPAQAVILATGGVSYPATGSTGSGYAMAQALGHTIIEPTGSLVPLVEKGHDCAKMQGLALKNIAVKLVNTKGKTVYEDFGELLFTHFGLSGPVILSASAHMARGEAGYTVRIDLKPALDEKTLDARILRDFSAAQNRDFENSLSALLPRSMIPVVIARSGIDPMQKVNSITKQQRRALLETIKCFSVPIACKAPVEDAIVTSGGVKVSEVNAKTMESKLVQGLYFAGELLDIDAYTGGFNLQIAWATGRLAGLSAAAKEFQKPEDAT